MKRSLPLRCVAGISAARFTAAGVATLVLLQLSALAVEKTVAAKKLPATTPWNLEKLSSPPAVEWLEPKAPVRSLFYAGETYGGKPTRVFAYYATPGSLAGSTEKETNLPAVVLVHGGGGTAFREWAELWAKRGYAAIAMDLAGHRPHETGNPHDRKNRTRLTDGGPDQGDDEKFGSIDKPPTEQWPYHAVANVLRAHSLIRSFPEVDVDRTAVTGISWGGYLTCIVAGVDNRFQAAVPVYGCGFLHDNSAWLDRLKKMTPEQRERWVELWDPSQYLPAVSMPILFVNGTNDFAYPLDSYMHSYAAVPGQKQLRITVNMPHGHPPGWAPQEIGLFIDHALGIAGSKALPQLSEPTLAGDKLQLRGENGVKIQEAALHFTTDTTPINMRKWQTLPLTVAGDSLSGPAPSPAATAWFVTATDDRGAIASTGVVFPSK